MTVSSEETATRNPSAKWIPVLRENAPRAKERASLIAGQPVASA